MRKKILLKIIFSLVCFSIHSQDVFLKSNLPIRNFYIGKDILIYNYGDFLKLKKKNDETREIYSGGYLIDFIVNNNEIWTLSNDYKNSYGTIRVYNVLIDEITKIYKPERKASILSFSTFKYMNRNTIVLSYIDGNIDWYSEDGTLIKSLGKFGEGLIVKL